MRAVVKEITLVNLLNDFDDESVAGMDSETRQKAGKERRKRRNGNEK
jgi:hypothetical protein